MLLICRDTQNYKQIAQVRHVFIRREIPYIYSSDAVVTLRGDATERWCNYLRPEKGVELIVASANDWNGIEPWKRYWKDLDELREKRTIPTWAITPKLE